MSGVKSQSCQNAMEINLAITQKLLFPCLWHLMFDMAHSFIEKTSNACDARVMQN